MAEIKLQKRYKYAGDVFQELIEHAGFQPEVAAALLNDIPDADVVPRAEVANKICCEIEEEIVAALESNYRALKEWDDGRCNDYILEMVNRIKGKIDALRGMEAFVEELKNKYAEG